MNNPNLYIQFGCGMSAPNDFKNFDSSINLYLQRNYFTKLFWRHTVVYPKTVEFGDIVKGLPISSNTVTGIYSSHVLEHLSYNDCIKALGNCYQYLKPGGILRCVLPDLSLEVKAYLAEKEAGVLNASSKFMEYSFLGYKDKPSTVWSLIRWYFSTHQHLWMWDYESLSEELSKIGFSNVYISTFGQSIDSTFNQAEDPSRFESTLVIEAVK